MLVNRTAVVVTAKQPVFDWLHAVDPTSHNLSLKDLNEEPSVYLLPESKNDADAAKSVRKYCKEIFAEELEGWWREPSVWPKDQSFRVFAQWFDSRFHSIVFDLAAGPLVREDE